MVLRTSASLLAHSKVLFIWSFQALLVLQPTADTPSKYGQPSLEHKHTTSIWSIFGCKLNPSNWRTRWCPYWRWTSFTRFGAIQASLILTDKWWGLFQRAHQYSIFQLPLLAVQDQTSPTSFLYPTKPTRLVPLETRLERGGRLWWHGTSHPVTRIPIYHLSQGPLLVCSSTWGALSIVSVTDMPDAL